MQVQDNHVDTFSLTARGECIGDIVFVLDSSGSIGMLNWVITLQFAIDIMKGLQISLLKTHVSVVTYSTEVETSFNLLDHFDVADIAPIVFGRGYTAGMTNTADGIKEMRKQFDLYARGNDIAQPIAILLTDGKSNIDPDRTIPEANLARAENIYMMAVGK